VSEPASIIDAIAAEGGRVTFARFMEIALTHPTLGYYSQADRLLRHGGDFNTAPALSPFFNRTLARLVTELVDASLSTLPTGAAEPAAVVELGGGEGQLAAAILGFWERERPDLRGKIAYRIVEVGARLRQRQAAAVAALLAVGWDAGWGRTLEEACAGTGPVVIVGNEFLDALPVHLVRVEGGALSEACVTVTALGLEQTWGPLSAQAAAEVEELFGTLDPQRLEVLTTDGVIEISPGLGELVRQVATVMPSGTLVNVDYGEWFAGVRRAGECCGVEQGAPRRRTIRGYFKHQMVLDPLARAGKQDLTADVDFAALDLHGRQHGFETVLFTTLAAFLRGGGAEAELQALRVGAAAQALGDETAPGAPGLDGAADVLEADRQATVIENLLDERDLGGAFKLMVQVKE
jgi:SAM-dependent MidA family methyltransferase